MSNFWEFDSLEFLTLWERATDDWLPTPFVYTSGTTSFYDHMRERRAVAERLQEHWDRSLDPVLAAIAQPDLRITVSGLTGSYAEHPDARRIRLMGLRRGSNGFVLKQQPGRIYSGTEGFTVTQCDPLDLAAALVAELPPREPGSQPDIPLVDPDSKPASDSDYSRSIVDDIFEVSDTERSKRFMDAPTVCHGGVEVEQGFSKYGPRGIAMHRLAWRDLADDGRYIYSDDPSVAVGADSKRMINAINVRVAAVIRVIKDEREGHYT